MHTDTAIFLISGKNPLLAKSGYASYSYNLAKILNSLGYRVEIFCFGAHDEVLTTKIGTVNIIGSKLYSTIFKDIEMAGLIFLAPKISLALKTVIATPSETRGKQSFTSSHRIIIWGIGPWSLATALLKAYSKVSSRTRFGIPNFIMLTDYFTTIKHEFSGTLSAMNVKDYGIWHSLKNWIAHITVIPFYSLLEGFLLKVSDKIITHYRSTEKILTDQFGISSKKYIRLPYSVELASQGQALQTQRSKSLTFPFPLSPFPLLLLVSRHDGRKGINVLLHAFAILNQRGAKYQAAIIGKGKLLNAHQKLTKKLNLKNVHLLGNVLDLQPFFKKSTLFVFPSLEEGSSSLAILEAMHSGLPIVSTNIDGIPEDLTHGKSALLVPPKNPQALAEAMEKLLRDRKLAKNLGFNAKKRYYQKYNLTFVKSALEKFLINITRTNS